MTDVEVFVDEVGTPLRVGDAYFTRSGRSVATTFAYDAGYLASKGRLKIDPAFELYSGNQYVGRMPGSFGDSAPDRWGRNLIARRERQLARQENRAARNLDEVDFLLGVNDETRQGALRFKAPGTDVFLSPDAEVPRLVDLPALLRASDEVAADDDGTDAYRVLLAAGTASLGGARPKASVRFDDGTLGIAKFPHSQDSWDVMAWEAVSLDIAERAGIRTPRRQLIRVGERHVLLLGRFDRNGDARIGYMSAMTMLEEQDGASGDYIEIAERLADVAASLTAERVELFFRAVLNVVLHNTDDHLRNHGLLAGPGGWRLSPVFDVNPNPDLGEQRSTSIAGATSRADEWEGLMELASASSIGPQDAVDNATKVADSVAEWPSIAAGYGIGTEEQRRMAGALDERIEMVRSKAAAQPVTPKTGRKRAKSSPKTNRGSFSRP